MPRIAVSAALVIALVLGACGSDRVSTSTVATPPSWATIDARLLDLAPATGLFAAEIGPDALLRAVHGRRADASLAIGSALGVYVLGIVSDRIAADDLAWDTRLDNGMTVEQAAGSMLSGDGDAGSSDALIDAVGVDEVEELMPAMGLGEASQDLTLPLVSPGALAASGHTAAALSAAGWFASPAELARAQQWIDSQVGLPGQAPLQHLLGATQPVDLDPSTWSDAAHIAGTGPGVRTHTWLLDRSDGRRFLLSIVANDPADGIDPDDVIAVAAAAIGRLATS